jgi:hypothetical protein
MEQARINALRKYVRAAEPILAQKETNLMSAIEKERPQDQRITPLLKTRQQPRPLAPEHVANMTVVTTPSSTPEMHDQNNDPTAPRND